MQLHITIVTGQSLSNGWADSISDGWADGVSDSRSDGIGDGGPNSRIDFRPGSLWYVRALVYRLQQ